jgi:hypothetical protein
MTHTVTIRDTDNPKYPVLVECTCNYQCQCKTEAEAEFRKRQHETAAGWIEASKGLQHGHN